MAGGTAERIEIAGAGPAGLAAAITLARAGRQVVVYEAQSEVGSRFRRDFQGLENWTTEQDVLAVLREKGLSTDFRCQPMGEGTTFDAWGRAYAVRSDAPLFYLIERGPRPGSLDHALLEQARSLGVEVVFNHRVRRIPGAGILAAGPRAADAIAVGYHCETDLDDGFWVICDDELAPKGYAYLLVWQGRATVKSCMFTGFKNEQQYVTRTVEAFRRLVGFEMRNPVPHGGAGNFRIPASALSGRHPQVGEQAGFQDTLWGFGMRLAIDSGILAARSLLEGSDYDALWRRHLLAQMEASVVNRALYSLLGNRGYRWFLRRMTQHPDPRGLLRRQYHPSPLKRWLKGWAAGRYESKRKDVSCNHVDCACVWCRHGEHAEERPA